MEEVTLDKAIALLASDKQKERADGLGGMRILLSDLQTLGLISARSEAHSPEE